MEDTVCHTRHDCPGGKPEYLDPYSLCVGKQVRRVLDLTTKTLFILRNCEGKTI